MKKTWFLCFYAEFSMYLKQENKNTNEAVQQMGIIVEAAEDKVDLHSNSKFLWFYLIKF